MADADVRLIGLPSRELPTPMPDNTEPNDSIRTTSYREPVVLSLFPGKQPLADEGSYFYFTNPTIGTAVAHALTTAFSQTAALFAIRNSHATKSLQLDFMRLTITGTVPTGVGSARVVSRGKIPLNVAIAHDVYTFQFGGADYIQQTAPLTAVRAVQAAGFIAHCAPVIAKPGEWIVIYRYGAGEATNTNNYEYEVGLFQR